MLTALRLFIAKFGWSNTRSGQFFLSEKEVDFSSWKVKSDSLTANENQVSNVVSQ